MARTKNTIEAGSDPPPEPTNTSIQTTVQPVVRTGNACQTVLGVNELLENIIVHLPPLKILDVRRVTTIFRDTVAKSPSIKAKLFLRLTEPKSVWQYTNSVGWSGEVAPAIINTILVKPAPPLKYPTREFRQVPVVYDSTPSDGIRLCLDSTIFDMCPSDPPSLRTHVTLLLVEFDPEDEYEATLSNEVRSDVALTAGGLLGRLLADQEALVSVIYSRKSAKMGPGTGKDFLAMVKEITGHTVDFGVAYAEFTGFDVTAPENEGWQKNGQAPWLGAAKITGED